MAYRKKQIPNLKHDSLVAWSAVLTFIASAVMIGVTLVGLREQLWLQTFAEYTRRYAEIVDALPSDAIRPGAAYDYASLPPSERDALLRGMRRYLNLCSEEFFLNSRGKIDATTWEIWLAGMRSTARLPGFRVAWPLLHSEYDYYPTFQEFMDRLGPEAGPTGAPRGAPPKPAN
ncbi:MAG: hypothetical protein WCI75_17695 [candidate division NC10 bacterium]